MLSLDIVVVNWNAGRQLWECLESIVGASRKDVQLMRVMVVDNASRDGSLDRIDRLPLPLNIIRNEENMGFAAACNKGAKSSAADYLLFLNPDTRLAEDSLIKPLSFMEHSENWRVGIMGIQLVDEDSRVSRTCTRFPKPSMFFSKMLGLDRLSPRFFPSHFMTEWDHSGSCEVEHVIGAFFLVRRFLFEELGGFDERFFVYLEDLDFSLRARQAGYSSYYLAGSQAYHKGGGTSEQVKAQRLFYSLRSRILYGYKHFGDFSATALLMGTILIEPLSRLVLALSHLSLAQFKETLSGYWALWRSLPAISKTAWIKKQ